MNAGSREVHPFEALPSGVVSKTSNRGISSNQSDHSPTRPQDRTGPDYTEDGCPPYENHRLKSWLRLRTLPRLRLSILPSTRSHGSPSFCFCSTSANFGKPAEQYTQDQKQLAGQVERLEEQV